MLQLEKPGVNEAEQIESIIQLTREQLLKRYPDRTSALRAQHAKAHSCVTAIFKVNRDLRPELRVGIFADSGEDHQAWVRFSNAAATVGADSPVVKGLSTHGSRGMAIKITNVSGTPTIPSDAPCSQDFLMVNHPVFPFPNVEDYEALTRFLAASEDVESFFKSRLKMLASGAPDMTDPVTARTLRTVGIIKRIQSLSTDAKPPAYQIPPATPLDNQYFGAAPFLFGNDHAMRVRATPRAPVAGDPSKINDPDYLRVGLRERLTAPGAAPAVFDFQIQVRSAADLAGNIDTQIEDACVAWDEVAHPFETVATITIPPQDSKARSVWKPAGISSSRHGMVSASIDPSAASTG